MRTYLQKRIKTDHYLYFLKWSLIALLIGLSIGYIGHIFGILIEYFSRVMIKYPLVLYAMPISGIAIVFIYNLLKVDRSLGTNLILDSILKGQNLPIKMAPLIFVSTLLSQLVGASAGREGAALQLGGSLGHFIGEFFDVEEKDKKLFTMCGMSACFSAIFGTPIAAGIFCIEIFSVGILHVSAFIPCVFAAFVSAGLTKRLGRHTERFYVHDVLQWNFSAAVKIIILSVLISLIAIIFCICIHESERIFNKYSRNQYKRIIFGSLIFIALTFVIDARPYFGGGIELINKAMDGDVRFYDFAFKLLFTTISLGCGFKGGEIIPSFAVGACFGAFFGNLIGIPYELGAACGMIGCFAGVTNCPIASMFMSIHLFGLDGYYFYITAILVSFSLSGYYSLYASQKFHSNKTKFELYQKD